MGFVQSLSKPFHTSSLYSLPYSYWKSVYADQLITYCKNVFFSPRLARLYSPPSMSSLKCVAIPLLHSCIKYTNAAIILWKCVYESFYNENSEAIHTNLEQ
ncbi:hypothetical protein FKM82_017540 [Ascaphus truei]